MTPPLAGIFAAEGKLLESDVWCVAEYTIARRLIAKLKADAKAAREAGVPSAEVERLNLATVAMERIALAAMMRGAK